MLVTVHTRRSNAWAFGLGVAWGIVVHLAATLLGMVLWMTSNKCDPHDSAIGVLFMSVVFDVVVSSFVGLLLFRSRRSLRLRLSLAGLLVSMVYVVVVVWGESVAISGLLMHC